MALVCFKNTLEEKSNFQNIDEDFLIFCCTRYAKKNEDLYSLILDQKVVLYKNDKVVPVDMWGDTETNADDEIVIAPEIASGDIGAWIQVVAGLALFAGGAYVATIGGSPHLGLGMMMAGSGMVLGGAQQLFMDYDLPSYRSGDDDNSQSYNWSGISTGARSDIPVPVIYGTHRVGGNVISLYTQQEGEFDYLYALLSLGEGEVEGVYIYNEATVLTPSDYAEANIIPDIELDDQPIRNFDNWEYWVRNGGNQQNSIPGFDGVRIEYSVGEEVTALGYTYTTQSAVDAARVELSAPALYTLDGSEIVSYNIAYQVEYKYEASPVGDYHVYPIKRWRVEQTVFSGGKYSCNQYKFEKNYVYTNATPLGIKIEITSNNYDPNKSISYPPYIIPRRQEYKIKYKLYDENDKLLEESNIKQRTSIQQVIDGENENGSPHRVPTVIYHRNAFVADKYLVELDHTAAVGDVYSINSERNGTGSELILTEKTKTGLKSSIELDFLFLGLPRGVYDLRISRTDGGASDDFSTEDTLNLDSVLEIVNGEYTYPNTALLGLKMKADGQLSGSIPNIVTKVKGVKVDVPDIGVTFDDYYYDATTSKYHEIGDASASVIWDGSSWTKQHSVNPMLCVRDMIVNKRYGLGKYFKSSDLYSNDVVTAIQECHKWYSNADSHFHEFDGVIEQRQSGIGMLLEMCNSFRCWPLWYNGKLGFRMDIDETPIQTIARSNTMSFSQHWSSLSEIPYKVYGHFTCEDNDYDMRSITALSNDDTLTKINSKTLGLKGITNFDRASRELKFKLNKVINCTHGIEFKCGLDMIHASAGDIIYVQDDLPQWGYGHRIVSYDQTTASILLDADYNVTATNVAHTVRFQDTNNALLEVNINSTYLNATGDTRTFRLSNHVGTPCNDSIITIGKSGGEPKKFRLLSVSRKKDNLVDCMAIEHLSSLYSSTAVSIVEDNYSALPNPLEKPGKPTLVAIEPLYYGHGFYIKATPPTGAIGVNSISVQIEDTIRDTTYDPSASPLIGSGSTSYKTIGQLTAPNWEMTYSDQTLERDRTYFFKLACQTRYKTGDYIIVSANHSYHSYQLASPTGVRISGRSPNVNTFIGKNVKLVWNSVGVNPNQSVSVRGYSIEVHHLNTTSDTLSSFTLKGTYFTRSEEFEYTFDENLSNSGNAVFGDKIIGFKLNTELEDGEVSSWGVPFVVSNTAPSNVVITSVGTSSGVRFSWASINETDDLAYYLYRTKAGSGSFSAWDDTRDSIFERILTVVEIDASDSLITIEVKAVDKFGQESSAVSEAFDATDALQNGGFYIDSTEGFYVGTGATRIQLQAGVGIWLGATAFGDAPFSVAADGSLIATSATISGNITATSGTFGGWTLTSTTLTSVATGTGITLDSGENRVAIWASSEEKVIMGYLDGVIRNKGSGTSTASTSATVCYDSTKNWEDDVLIGLELYYTSGAASGSHQTITDNDATTITTSTFSPAPSSGDTYEVRYSTNDYGFWAKDGDQLYIDGDITYENGDWLIGHDSSYLVKNSAGTTILRMGTDTVQTSGILDTGSGVIVDTDGSALVDTGGGTPQGSYRHGIFIYNTDGDQISRFHSGGMRIGGSTNSENYIEYDTSTGAFVFSSASENAITVGKGGDVTLIGDADGSEPAKLKFREADSDIDIEFYVQNEPVWNYAEFYMVGRYASLYFGTEYINWSGFYVYTGDLRLISWTDVDNNTEIYSHSDPYNSDLNITVKFEDTNSGIIISDDAWGDSFIIFYAGSYKFDLTTDDLTLEDATDTGGAGTGYITLDVGGSTRYLALLSSPPS